VASLPSRQLSATGSWTATSITSTLTSRAPTEGSAHSGSGPGSQSGSGPGSVVDGSGGRSDAPSSPGGGSSYLAGSPSISARHALYGSNERPEPTRPGSSNMSNLGDSDDGASTRGAHDHSDGERDASPGSEDNEALMSEGNGAWVGRARMLGAPSGGRGSRGHEKIVPPGCALSADMFDRQASSTDHGRSSATSNGTTSDTSSAGPSSVTGTGTASAASANGSCVDAAEAIGVASKGAPVDRDTMLQAFLNF